MVFNFLILIMIFPTLYYFIDLCDVVIGYRILFEIVICLAMFLDRL